MVDENPFSFFVPFFPDDFEILLNEISIFPFARSTISLSPLHRRYFCRQTPGRIAELVIGRPGDKGGKLKISGLRTVVLDEFDALLQYDAHVEPTVAIMQALDRQHGRSLQRVLCSATASDVIQTSSSTPTSEGGGGGDDEIFRSWFRRRPQH